MYLPTQFEERDVSVLHALVAAHPLGAWVTMAEGELVVNHVPFLLEPHRGPFGTLVAHVSRANPVWHAASREIESVVVFQGPQGYITPTWYPSKREHGKVVPTWNYAVVHAHGMPRAVDDPAWLRDHVARLTRTHESDRPAPWHVSDAPSGYIDGQVKGIVGIEIPVTRMIGKWKVSQNRSVPDRRGVVAGLEEAGDPDSRRMARLVSERIDESGQ